METIIARCCGLDVHKAQVTACVRLLIDGVVTEIVETFGTTTPDLLALRDWLKGHGVTDVAMESTGVYWKPVYYMLEDEFEVLLVNARDIKHVPGRKTTRSTRPGSRSCWRTGCCAGASCRPSRSAGSGI
jgi:transposase